MRVAYRESINDEHTVELKYLSKLDYHNYTKISQFMPILNLRSKNWIKLKIR